MSLQSKRSAIIANPTRVALDRASAVRSAVAKLVIFLIPKIIILKIKKSTNKVPRDFFSIRITDLPDSLKLLTFANKSQTMRLKEIVDRATYYIGNHRYMLALLFAVSVLSLLDIPLSPMLKMPEWLRYVYLICVGGFKAVVLMGVFYPLYKIRYGRVIMGCIIAIYGLLGIVNAVSFCYYDFGITRKLILIVAQTTPKEVAEFLPGVCYNLSQLFYAPGFYVFLFFLLIAICVLRMSPRKIIGQGALWVGGLGLIASMTLCLCCPYTRSAHLLSTRLVKYGKDVWMANEEYKLLLTQKSPLPYKETVSSQHLASTVVVVIGESAHRRHLSLYGYPLPTTPSLDAMADSLIVFTDVIGSSRHTSGNMERILSFKPDDTTSGDGLKYPLLIDLFNEMGYKTFWLSNQELYGILSNTSGVMSMNADVIKYVGADNSKDALSLRYDEALLAPMHDAINDSAENSLIFLHLFGSHVEYKNRYPERFNHFTARDEKDTFHYEWLDDKMAQRRAEYDNSILYTDYVLDNVIRAVTTTSTPAIMIYFSDHGDEVYDFSNFTGRNSNTVQVPFIIYVNKRFADANADLMQRVKQVSDRPMSSANLIHLLITLTGGTYHLYDPTLDILSPSYIIRPRYVDEEVWQYDCERTSDV